MWTSFIESHSLLITALVVGVLCGCVSVLVDSDHVIAHLIGATHGRIFHKSILVGCCIMLCGCIAYIGGFYIRQVLGR